MSNQAPTHALDAAGRPKRISIERILNEDERERIDVELVLNRESPADSPEFTVRFIDSRDIKIGDGHDGIDLGSYFLLSVWYVSQDGWDGVRFKAENLEQGCTFSLYCRRFECPAE